MGLKNDTTCLKTTSSVPNCSITIMYEFPEPRITPYKGLKPRWFGNVCRECGTKIIYRVQLSTVQILGEGSDKRYCWEEVRHSCLRTLHERIRVLEEELLIRRNYER